MKENNIIYFKFPWDRIGITQYYSNSHQAIDNAGTVSNVTNKYAYLPCEAKILKNTFYSDYGYAVEYEAKDERGTFIMANGHLKKKSNLVVGKYYSMGTIIGEIGTSGTSTGIHDHFRMALNGKRVNPLDYLYVYEGQFVHNDDKKKVKYYKELVKTYDVIVDEIPVYTNSTNAKNGKNSVGTWSNGTYYVFNKSDGMINITKIVSQAGAWINPADNVIKEVELPKEEKPIETPVEDTPNENIEKEPVIEEKPIEPDDVLTEEINEAEGQEQEKIANENIFVKIIKNVINFIIKIFKR